MRVKTGSHRTSNRLHGVCPVKAVEAVGSDDAALRVQLELAVADKVVVTVKKATEFVLNKAVCFGLVVFLAVLVVVELDGGTIPKTMPSEDAGKVRIAVL